MVKIWCNRGILPIWENIDYRGSWRKLRRWYGDRPNSRIASRCSLVGYPLFLFQLYIGYSSCSFSMRASRWVFASTDAAAMLMYLLSPFTTHSWEMSRYGLNLFPSTRMNSGRVPSPSMARCMARIDALRILISSIF